MNKRILAISPHADDIELGAGGTLLKLRDQGYEIHVFLFSAKDESHLCNGDVKSATRLEEFLCSMRQLTAEYTIASFHEEELDDIPRSKAVQELDECIKNFKPDIVLLPVPSFHQEHQYVYDCSIAACRPTKDFKPRTIYAYEYPAANWGDSAAFNPAFGGVYSDITDYMVGKQQLLECHKSQNLTKKNGLVSLGAVETLAKMRGYESGCDHAELLYLMRGYI